MVPRRLQYFITLTFLCTITLALESSCTTQSVRLEASDDLVSLLQITPAKARSPHQESAIEKKVVYRTSRHRLQAPVPNVAPPIDDFLEEPVQNVHEVTNLEQNPDKSVEAPSSEATKTSNISSEANFTRNGSNFWAGMNGNLARTGASPYAVSKDFNGGPTWSISLEQSSRIVGTPLIDSLRNIYLTTTFGKVLKLDVDGSSIWNRSVGANVTLTPAIDDGALHLATEGGEAVSIDMATGNLTWRRKLSKCAGPSARAVMASSGVVVHALRYADEDCSTRTYINVLDAKTGEELWTYSPRDFIGHRGPPVGLFAIKGPVIVFTDSEGNVCKLDLKSGKELWGHDSELLSVVNASHVTKGMSSTMAKVNKSFNGSEMLMQTPDEGQASTSGLSSTMAKFNQTSNSSDELSQEPDVGPAVTSNHQGHQNNSNQSSFGEFEVLMKSSGVVLGPDEVVYVASNPLSGHGRRAGRLEALNFTTGRVLWQVNLAHAISSGPVVGQLHPGGKGNLSVLITVGGVSHFPSTDDELVSTRRAYSGKVLTFAALTGASTNWTYEQEPWPADEQCNSDLVQAFSNPAIGGDGTVYLGSGNGMLYAIRDHDGDGFVNETKEVSSYSAGHAFIASPAIAPGLLVAAPCNGMVVFKLF